MREPELDAVAASLKGSHRQVVGILLVAGVYLEELAEHDERAAWLAQEIDRAFTAMDAENIAAASTLADRENRG